MLLFRQGLVSHLQRMMMSGFCQGCIFPSSDSVRLIFAASSSYLIVFLLFRSNTSSQMFRRSPTVYEFCYYYPHLQSTHSSEIRGLCLMSTQTRAFISGKNKVAQNEKQKKLRGFLYSKNMANFEAFRQVISSSINLLFLKSVLICNLY